MYRVDWLWVHRLLLEVHQGRVLSERNAAIRIARFAPPGGPMRNRYGGDVIRHVTYTDWRLIDRVEFQRGADPSKRHLASTFRTLMRIPPRIGIQQLPFFCCCSTIEAYTTGKRAKRHFLCFLKMPVSHVYGLTSYKT